MTQNNILCYYITQHSMLGVYMKKGCRLQLASCPSGFLWNGVGVGEAGSSFSPLLRNGSCLLQNRSPPPSSCLRNSFPSNPHNNPHHPWGHSSEVLSKHTGTNTWQEYWSPNTYLCFQCGQQNVDGGDPIFLDAWAKNARNKFWK